MFAEFGFQIGYGAPPPARRCCAAGWQRPGRHPRLALVRPGPDVQLRWPYGTKNGLTTDSAKRIVAMVQKAFGG